MVLFWWLSNRFNHSKWSSSQIITKPLRFVLCAPAWKLFKSINVHDDIAKSSCFHVHFVSEITNFNVFGYQLVKNSSCIVLQFIIGWMRINHSFNEVILVYNSQYMCPVGSLFITVSICGAGFLTNSLGYPISDQLIGLPSAFLEVHISLPDKVFSSYLQKSSPNHVGHDWYSKILK